jgi:hypothetical protein
VSEARWCVEDSRTGMPVAHGSAPTAEAASREATHYAWQYAQDHPVRWWVRQDRKTLLQGSLEGVSVTVRGSVGDLLTALGKRLA